MKLVEQKCSLELSCGKKRNKFIEIILHQQFENESSQFSILHKQKQKISVNLNETIHKKLVTSLCTQMVLFIFALKVPYVV